MSRSYKKHPIVIQEKNDAKLANRQVRRNKFEEIPKGGAYKKRKVGWTWSYYYSLEDAKHDYYRLESLQKRFSTLEEYLIYYKKKVISK